MYPTDVCIAELMMLYRASVASNTYVLLTCSSSQLLYLTALLFLSLSYPQTLECLRLLSFFALEDTLSNKRRGLSNPIRFENDLDFVNLDWLRIRKMNRDH